MTFPLCRAGALRCERLGPVNSDMNSKRKPKTAAGIEETWPGCDYSDDEREFIVAMDRFRHESKRRFPTCRDILAVIHELGYRKQNHETQIAQINAD